MCIPYIPYIYNYGCICRNSVYIAVNYDIVIVFPVGSMRDQCKDRVPPQKLPDERACVW